MYEKKTLKFKDVRKMLQNNELMKNTDSTEKASRLVGKEQRRRSQNRGFKKDTKVLAETMIATIINSQGT